MTDFKTTYFNDGSVVVNDAVEPDLLDRLEAAGRRVVDKVRSGQVDVSGQGPDSTGVLGVIAPEFAEPAFAEYLISDSITRYAEAFLGPELRLGHVHLWCTERPYDTGWHRDIGQPPVNYSEAEEMAILNQPFVSLKWQTALLDDPCLWVVPGSQRRYRTEPEAEVLFSNTRQPIPGGVQMDLRRGQTVFWNGKLIHRGHKPDDLERRLSVTGGLRRYDDPQEPMDYVGSDWEWRLSDQVRAALPEKAQLYYDRWRGLPQGAN